ncbi:MAG: M56 family metallopeptidase [Blastocatellales bacterium]
MRFIAVIENFILFSTLLALCGFAVAIAVRAATECGWRQWQPETLTRIYSAAVVLPPLVAAWLTSAAFLPEWWLGEAAFDAAHPQPLHQLHLLGELTAKLEPALAYVTVSLVLLSAISVAWLSVRGYLRLNALIERLDVKAQPPLPEQLALIKSASAHSKLRIGLVMSDHPFSFVWGFHRSRLVLSSGLLNMLTPDELRGVIAHEAAHDSRRDNLAKLVLSLFGYASLAFPLTRLILKYRAEQVELLCDEMAAARTAVPLDLAEALVKLKRRTIMPAPAIASGFFPVSALDLERRVQRLLDLSDALPAPTRLAALSRPYGYKAVFIATLSVLTLLVVSLAAPLAVHEATEALIHVLK